MFVYHNDKPYFIQPHMVSEFIYDLSMNAYLQTTTLNKYTFDHVPRFTTLYSDIFNVVTGKAPFNIYKEFVPKENYVGPDCNEQKLLAIIDLSSNPLSWTLSNSHIDVIYEYIMKCFTMLSDFHQLDIVHGSPLVQYIMIRPDKSIGIVNNAFLELISENKQLTFRNKVTQYFWEHPFITPALMKFFDFYVLCCSIQDIILVNPSLLHRSDIDSNYNKLKAIFHCIGSNKVTRSDGTLKGDLKFIRSIFMSPSFTNDILVNKELQKISLTFYEFECANTLEESVLWLSYDLYTNFRHIYKVFDRTYYGPEIKNMELEITNYIKQKLPYFDMFIDISSNDQYAHMMYGQFQPRLLPITRVPLTDLMVKSLCNLLFNFTNENFYHGSLTLNNVYYDVSNNDFQLINLQFAKILQDEETIDGNIDITLGKRSNITCKKLYLFFVDTFRLIVTMYNQITFDMLPIIEDTISSKNIHLAYEIIKEAKEEYLRQSQVTIYDLSFQRINTLIQDHITEIHSTHLDLLLTLLPDLDH